MPYQRRPFISHTFQRRSPGSPHPFPSRRINDAITFWQDVHARRPNLVAGPLCMDLMQARPLSATFLPVPSTVSYRRVSSGVPRPSARGDSVIEGCPRWLSLSPSPHRLFPPPYHADHQHLAVRAVMHESLPSSARWSGSSSTISKETYLVATPCPAD